MKRLLGNIIKVMVLQLTLKGEGRLLMSDSPHPTPFGIPGLSFDSPFLFPLLSAKSSCSFQLVIVLLMLIMVQSPDFFFSTKFSNIFH